MNQQIHARIGNGAPFSQPAYEPAPGEEALVERLKAGDEDAFRELVSRYQGKVIAHAGRILHNRNDAEDLAQQVFAAVYFAIGSYNSRGSLLAWIYRITVNQCLDYMRKKKNRMLTFESDLSLEEVHWVQNSPAATDPDLPADRKLALRDFVAKLLALLSPEDRSLLILREVEGHSVNELAAMTGMTEGTVKVRLFRVRRKLIKAAQTFGAPGPARSVHAATLSQAYVN